MDNGNKDPRTYQIKNPKIEGTTLDLLLDAYYPEMRRIGFVLEALHALPITEENGRVTTTGNYSMRVEGGTSFLVTGSGANKAVLEREGIVYIEEIDYEKGEYRASGEARPSRETLIHDQIYHARPEVNVVLHLHDQVALEYGRARRTEHAIFFANRNDAQEVVDALADENYVELPEHGQFVVGKTIDEALAEARKHHRDARGRQVRTESFRYIMSAAAGIACAFLVQGFSYVIDEKVRNCEYYNNLDGTVTYTCPVEISCGNLKNWEGEKEVMQVDGKRACTYAMNGSS